MHPRFYRKSSPNVVGKLFGAHGNQGDASADTSIQSMSTKQLEQGILRKSRNDFVVIEIRASTTRGRQQLQTLPSTHCYKTPILENER
ncbi:hypothetical protein Poly24_11760 [Rosistilla carotiformis]|uniref:Uncharacterized protein n=1 Tax=Rosistilla carotiformis TaxID=2528017 RepID=A0A518JPK2_9BACT|nr:hypothetical protein Poly24_11760 [Rosistilla carotiformis]